MRFAIFHRCFNRRQTGLSEGGLTFQAKKFKKNKRFVAQASYCAEVPIGGASRPESPEVLASGCAVLPRLSGSDLSA
jgi:hypothetical protein